MTKVGIVKKFEKIKTIAVNKSIREAKQKLLNKKGIDLSRRKIIIMPFNK